MAQFFLMFCMTLAYPIQAGIYEADAMYSDILKYLKTCSELTPDSLTKAGMTMVGVDEYERRTDKGTLTVRFKSKDNSVEPTTKFMTMTLIPAKPTQVTQEVIREMISKAVEHQTDPAKGTQRITTQRFKSKMRPRNHTGFTEIVTLTSDGRIESMVVTGIVGKVEIY